MMHFIMDAVAFSLLFMTFFTAEINGMRFRSPCSDSARFRCDNGDCIYKHQWCDRSRHCTDGSDEKYCNVRKTALSKSPDCNDIHFICKNSSMCIPSGGYCDGYSSCPDTSDEENCPCEELHDDQGYIEYEAFLSTYRTQQKCWKLKANENQYINMKLQSDFYRRECKHGNITIVDEGMARTSFAVIESEQEVFSPNVICSSNSIPSAKYYGDVVIRYQSNYYTSSSSTTMKDFLNITYEKVNLICDEPDAFRCSKNFCIFPEKQCDGYKDCKDGLDEQNCDYGALSAAYLETNRIKAVAWLKNQHNAEWSWKEHTHRAVVALYLSKGANYNGSVIEDELFAKQLELELSTYLLRIKSEKASTSEMSAYINALLAICHDPRNFYGSDLIVHLKKELERTPEYVPPFPYLTLCSAKEPVSEAAVDSLLQILDSDSPNHGFVLEIQALTIMALSCIANNENKYANLKQNISEAINSLKKNQMGDGSFGNEYTTALVLQALIANNQESVMDWNPKSSVQFLSKRQDENGSFGDFLTTYLILPILNAKSLMDIGKINCTKGLKRPRDETMVSDIKSRLGGKTIIKYSLYIGDEKDQIHPIVLRTPENITVLELMTLAADADPKYKFKTHKIKQKRYVYEISNIPNDPMSNKFWFIYQGLESGTVPIPEQSPDKVRAHKQDHIIMWYKTLNSM